MNGFRCMLFKLLANQFGLTARDSDSLHMCLMIQTSNSTYENCSFLLPDKCSNQYSYNNQYTAVIIQSAAHYPRLLFIVKAMGVVFSSADIYNNVSTRKNILPLTTKSTCL